MTSSQDPEASQITAAEEQRGGDRPDWDSAKPGEPLPELKDKPRPVEPDYQQDVPDFDSGDSA